MKIKAIAIDIKEMYVKNSIANCEVVAIYSNGVEINKYWFSSNCAYLYNAGGFNAYNGTKAEYFSSGTSFFDDVIKRIKLAKEFVFLEFFIVAEGALFTRIFDLLSEKVKQGVDVRVIYDDMGSHKVLSRKSKLALKNSGIKIQPFNKITPFVSLALNYRDHRKIIVIDGKIGYLGGFNIGDEYLSHHPRITPWRDSQMKIEGEGVYYLQQSFLDDFYYAKGSMKHFDNMDLFSVKVDERCEVKLLSFSPKNEYKNIKEEYDTIICYMLLHELPPLTRTRLLENISKALSTSCDICFTIASISSISIFNLLIFVTRRSFSSDNISNLLRRYSSTLLMSDILNLSLKNLTYFAIFLYNIILLSIITVPFS